MCEKPMIFLKKKGENSYNVSLIIAIIVGSIGNMGCLSLSMSSLHISSSTVTSVEVRPIQLLLSCRWLMWM
jgi:hypothetical protein